MNNNLMKSSTKMYSYTQGVTSVPTKHLILREEWGWVLFKEQCVVKKHFIVSK